VLPASGRAARVDGEFCGATYVTHAWFRSTACHESEYGGTDSACNELGSTIVSFDLFRCRSPQSMADGVDAPWLRVACSTLHTSGHSHKSSRRSIRAAATRSAQCEPPFAASQSPSIEGQPCGKDKVVCAETCCDRLYSASEEKVGDCLAVSSARGGGCGQLPRSE
jgi:hypothetical protein